MNDHDLHLIVIIINGILDQEQWMRTSNVLFWVAPVLNAK